MDKKIIETNNKPLLMLGYLLLGISIFLILNSIFQATPTQGYIYNNLHLGIVGIAVGIIFVLLGKKKKCIIFLENEFICKINRHIFTEKYTNINLIHTFIDSNNRSKNLLIYFDENKTLSFSSSYWLEEKLIDAYKEFIIRSKNFIDINEISVENELDW